MSSGAEKRLQDLAISLPPAPKPLGAYVPAVEVGELLFLSGTLPLEGGVAKFQGRIGAELSIADGRSATRLAALNALALAKQQLGSLDEVTRVVRLTVSLATTPEFRDHAKVADGRRSCWRVFSVRTRPRRAWSLAWRAFRRECLSSWKSC